MKALLLTSEFPPGPGGIGTHAQQLAYHLSNRGWNLLVLSPQEYASEDEIKLFIRKQPYKIVRLRRWPEILKVTDRFFKTLYWAHFWQPNVIIASGQRQTWLSAKLAKWIGRPWLAVGHGSEFLMGAAWERYLTRKAFAKANMVVVVSHYTESLMYGAGIQPRHVTVIPNGANPDIFRPELNMTNVRENWKAISGPILLTVGSVTQRKAQDLVIGALPRLVNEFPTLNYLIAGNPILQPELMGLARQLGVDQHVHFLGRVTADELPYLYNLSDIFVLVSRQANSGDVEGYGIAVIEAALCGKPGIVTRDCGLEETVIDGETGFVVNQEDPESIAKAAGRLLQDESLRKRMGWTAYKRAITEATWAIRIKEYDELLRSIITDTIL